MKTENELYRAVVLDLQPILCLGARLMMLVALAGCVSASAQVPSRAAINPTALPHLMRAGVNLCKDPTLTGKSFWTVGPSAVWDAAVSRSPGSKSVKLHATAREKGEGLTSDLVPVTAGRNYRACCPNG